MKKLANKVAVVTGASKGIGAAIARTLAENGAAVVVNYASDRAGAERVAAEITGKDGKAVAVQGSVAVRADVQRLFAETRKHFGPVDILVNNAGICKFEPLEAVSEAEFHRQFDTNVLGPILVSQEALNHFNPSGGSIINVSSVASHAAPPYSAVYSSTKGALDTLTRVLARELAARKIRVNTLAPGGVETEGFIASGIKGSDFEKQMIANTPLGRLGQPNDIATVALFLASDDAAWITGERLVAAGGSR